MRTIECSCRLWPSPGIYAITSTLLVRRTRATLRNAELGFLGVVVYTRVQTPRRWGAPFRAGVLVLSSFCSRPFRTSCAIVGNETSSCGDRYSPLNADPQGATFRPAHRPVGHGTR